MGIRQLQFPLNNTVSSIYWYLVTDESYLVYLLRTLNILYVSAWKCVNRANFSKNKTTSDSNCWELASM